MLTAERLALQAGRAVGANTALVTSNPDAPLAVLADHLLVTDTGPEAIARSTRLKAGLALKVVLCRGMNRSSLSRSCSRVTGTRLA